MDVSYPIIDAGTWSLRRKVAEVTGLSLQDIVTAERITTDMLITARVREHVT